MPTGGPPGCAHTRSLPSAPACRGGSSGRVRRPRTRSPCASASTATPRVSFAASIGRTRRIGSAERAFARPVVASVSRSRRTATASWSAGAKPSATPSPNGRASTPAARRATGATTRAAPAAAQGLKEGTGADGAAELETTREVGVCVASAPRVLAMTADREEQAQEPDSNEEAAHRDHGQQPRRPADGASPGPGGKGGTALSSSARMRSTAGAGRAERILAEQRPAPRERWREKGGAGFVEEGFAPVDRRHEARLGRRRGAEVVRARESLAADRGEPERALFAAAPAHVAREAEWVEAGASQLPPSPGSSARRGAEVGRRAGGGQRTCLRRAAGARGAVGRTSAGPLIGRLGAGRGGAAGACDPRTGPGLLARPPRPARRASPSALCGRSRTQGRGLDLAVLLLAHASPLAGNHTAADSTKRRGHDCSRRRLNTAAPPRRWFLGGPGEMRVQSTSSPQNGIALASPFIQLGSGSRPRSPWSSFSRNVRRSFHLLGHL